MYYDTSTVANSELVEQFLGTIDRYSVSDSSRKDYTDDSQYVQSTSFGRQTPVSCFSIIRKSFEDRQIPKRAVDIMLASWKPSTQKQYSVYIRRWFLFCSKREINTLQVTVNDVLDFLTQLFDSGLSYDTINIARSALSSLGFLLDGFVVGQHPLIKRFLNGVFNLRPSKARYKDVWDVNIVLKYLKNLPDVRLLTLKNLTLKLAMLIALTQASRVQSLKLLTLEGLRQGHNSIVLQYSNSLKQCKPGRRVPYVELKEYFPDKNICVVHTLREYIKRTEPLRKGEHLLFISYLKPYHAVTASTISRWLKTVMHLAGIDINVYKAHSIRGASTSKVSQFVPIKEILSVAGWNNATTFNRFYNRDIQQQRSFSDSLLDSSQ
ncbi:uncharacterized protein LOC127860415 [Dreissena polymorpha]|uniref:Core-binding (CB) domain-containing protein n=1 Tax=Dreissena polymorpha TaxID=45954 RepID=A0A9D4FVU1_DREPO|nr:uncharacterized protein LOC127833839 [Dreissena polymorpha]XP_052254446.1 uncharacterized protein LOC127860415 [Dreissena polymorpha]KAH3806244.1 hypothetical protein DPMN_134563 [Dreissena polymorpha]